MDMDAIIATNAAIKLSHSTPGTITKTAFATEELFLRSQNKK